MRTVVRQFWWLMWPMGPELSGRLPTGGQAALWRAALMFDVWNRDRWVFLPVRQHPRWCVPGGAGWRCRRVLLAEDIQPRNVGAVPSIGVRGCPDVLGNQPAQRVEREVVSLRFARWRGCAEGVPRGVMYATG